MSDPKDSDKKEDDFTSLLDIADFDHTEDPEAEAYFAQIAQEDQEDSPFDYSETLNDSIDDFSEEIEIDNAQELTGTFSKDLTQKLQDNFQEQHNDDDQELFENNDQELTQVNFNPQDLFDNDLNDDQDNNLESYNEDLTSIEQTSSFNDDFSDIPDEVQKDTFDEHREDDEFEIPQETSSQDEVEIEKEPILEVVTQVLAPSVEKNLTETNSSIQKSQTTSSYETFEEVNKFAKMTRYGAIKTTGNPPFSIIISNIKFQEDAHDIFTILEHYGFINNDNRQIIKKGLSRGSAIISRVSEFAAIYLYHQLYQKDIKLQIGPSELIYQSSANSFDTNDQHGHVNKDHLLQNKSDSKYKTNQKIASILLSASSHIPGYKIEEFLSICHESEQFDAYPNLDEQQVDIDKLEDKQFFQQLYQKLENQIRTQIQSKKGNAGVDFKFHITPMFNNDNKTYHYQLHLQCHAVWIVKSTKIDNQ